MRVSVYITTKNRLELLKRAVESVFAQSYADVELLVSDDGSTDGSHQYLEELQSQGKLIAITSNESRGACTARNLAIEKSTGDFITGLDDDDWFHPQRIEEFVNFWQNLSETEANGLSGLFSNAVEIYKDVELKKSRVDKVTYSDLRRENLIGNQVFAKRYAFTSINGFDPDMPAWQDWECWLRMANACGPFLNCGACSYISDASHDEGRITDKNQSVIRSAYQRLRSKMGQMTFSESIELNRVFCNYRQVVPKLSEIIMVLLVGDIHLAGSTIKRKVLSCL